MSNTAHQRQIRDLQASGLNPILSTKYGGASSPSGAMSKPENSFEKAIASAFQVSQLKQSEANVKKIEQDTLTSTATEQKLKGDLIKILSEYEKNKASKRSIDMETAHNARDMAFLPEGISRLAFKHTVFNMAGTEFYNWLKHSSKTFRQTNSFNKNDPIYMLPKNRQKKLQQDMLRLEMQRPNLTWDQWKTKASQLWYRHFGNWRSVMNKNYNVVKPSR